jgi:transcriptional regulator with XRE-family HTH domain
MSVEKKEMGRRIKRARELKAIRDGFKYTQSDLASDVDRSRSFIGDIERGKAMPSVTLLSEIAKACEAPFNFFDVEGYGEPIQKRRESLNLTIEEVASAAGLPLEKIQKIENNEPIKMSMGKWKALGKALGLEDYAIYRIASEDFLYRIAISDFNEDVNGNSRYISFLSKFEKFLWDEEESGEE